MSKAIVCLSGGIASATLLGEAVEQYKCVEAVSFVWDESRRIVWEDLAAHEIANVYSVKRTVVDITSVVKQFQYFEKHPGSGLIFASILAGIAWDREAECVLIGTHAGNIGFFMASSVSVEASTEGKVRLRAPYLFHQKSEIIRKGCAIGVPYSVTRTCVDNKELACGGCESCKGRKEAFALLELPDPIQYGADYESKS